MTDTDWPQIQIDSSTNGLSNTDGTSDLFGGALFGDELLDMYQGSAVVGEGGSGEVGHNASGKFYLC